jgi:hypothetical protein
MSTGKRNNADEAANMNEEMTQTLSLKAAYAFGAAHGLEREVTEIRDMVIEWDSLHVVATFHYKESGVSSKHSWQRHSRQLEQETWPFLAAESPYR